MIDLSDLAVFRMVAETGGVTRAAARLHRVQSNVTTRLQKLEESLGVDLFTRQGRGLKLAPAGEVLLGYAERLLDLADEAREAVRTDSFSGTLRLGAMEAAAAARLPAPLAEFHRRHPHLTLELRTGPSRPLVGQLLQGEIDAAVVAGPVTDHRLHSRPVCVERLVLAAPLDFQLPATPASGQAGSRLTLLTFQAGCAYRQVLEQWAATHHILPDRVVELSSYHAMLGCVAAGMGVAIVPHSLIDVYSGRDSLCCFPLPPALAQVETHLVWRKTGPQARLDALADLLQGWWQPQTPHCPPA